MKRGSVLLMALWIIAVLSVMVLSFATEAHLQTGINVYIRERNRVNRLVDAGQILAEVVISDYANVADWSEDEDFEKLLEDDRWLQEKRSLKSGRSAVIGPILIDESDPDSGTVKIEIQSSRKLNINTWCESQDSNYRLRWELLLMSHGIPEDYEVETWNSSHSSKTHLKLINLLIASWNDWCDEDDAPTAIDGEDGGAEKAWYEEEYDDSDTDPEFQRFPRNGAIPDIKELSFVRGFRDFPVVLTGGVLNPEDDPKEQIQIQGLTDMFSTLGSAKVFVNDCTAEELLTVPGIHDASDEEDLEQTHLNVEAILAAKHEMPDYDVDESAGWWEFRDFNDLLQRAQDYDPNVTITTEAEQYLTFKPDESTIFEIVITCESMGMTRTVKAKAYLKDKEVRYIEWEEDPKEEKR